MNLQGRDLSQGMQGKDVLVLNVELVLLGLIEQPGEWDRFDDKTAGAVGNLQEAHNLPVTGVVDEATAGRIRAALEETGRFAIYVMVRTTDGRAVQGILVEASDRDMRRNQPLGEAETDVRGQCFITYTHKDFARLEKVSADLILRLVDSGGNEITATDTYFNAPRVHIADFELGPEQYRGKSEFERHVEDIQPLIGNIRIADLREDEKDQDFSFLSGETGIPIKHLRFLHNAFEFFERTQVLAEVYYGLFRQGLSTTYRRLLAEKPFRLREALKISIHENIIPARLEVDMENILAALHHLAVAVSFEQTEDGEAPGLGQILQTAPISSAHQRQVVDFALRYDGDSAEFWSKLGNETDLDDEEFTALRFTIESTPLILGHLPTLEALQRLRQERGWETGREAAWITQGEWQDLTAQSGYPDQFEDHVAFAEAIAGQTEAAYPTAAVAARLAHDPDREEADLRAFFDNNPDFDLLHTPVSQFINNGANLDNIGDIDVLQTSLLNWQHLARITPTVGRYEAMTALLDNDFYSATRVAQTNYVAFKRQMRPIMGEATILETYSLAQEVTTQAQLLLQQLRDQLLFPHSVLPGIIVEEEEEEEGLPDVTELLGTITGCACEHCQSVLGPAAYMVDLLRFLDLGRQWHEDDPPSPLDELLRRRPDIEHIELTCANSHTPLPYIDLVNEILENVVFRIEDDGTLSPTSVPAVPAPDAPEDEVNVYRAVIAQWQTTASDDPLWEAELKAAPAHELIDVYENQLVNAEFPWALPFDLYQEKARLFSQHLRLPIFELMQLYSRHPDQIARAYLWMSQSLFQKVTTPPVDGTGSLDAGAVARYWGLDSATTLPDAMPVPDFLQRTGLDHDELNELVSTQYLKADDGSPYLEVDTSAGFCDIATHVVIGLETAIYDRIHRFLRLQRHINWSIPQLDTFLSNLEFTDITQETIVQLMAFNQILSECRFSIDQGLSLYSDSPRRELLANRIDLHPVHLTLLIDTVAQNPFNQPSDTVSFLEVWEALHELGFEPQEAAYLLFHEDQVPAAYAPDPETLTLFLTALGEAAVGLPEEDQIQTILVNLEQLLGLEQSLIRDLIYDDADAGTDAALRATSDPTQPAVHDLRFWDPGASLSVEQASQMLIRIQKAARLIQIMGLAEEELRVVETTREWNSFLNFNELPFTEDPGLTESARRERAAAMLAIVDARRIQNDLSARAVNLFNLMAFALTSGEGTDPADAAAIDGYFHSVTTNLATGTGWDESVLSELFTSLGFNTTEAFRTVRYFLRADTYRRLNAAMQLLRRWQLQTTDLALLGNPATTARNAAEKLEEVASRKYDRKRWLEILAPLMDHLREQKRDALLGYILHYAYEASEDADPREKLFASSYEIYGEYLIDPEMSSCMLTSRIKQANASIQLFVQRLLMNLETEIPPEDYVDYQNHWRQWEWVKNYRVWEANRKVFLYPENWTFSELRDNKSPFFRAFEDELLQGELNSELVENAFHAYVQKVDRVARLDVRSLYEEEERGILHVFARTFSTPYQYYYRRRLPTDEWSAWEPVHLNVEGDHLIPVVHNGRLMLFWPLFREESEWIPPGDADSEGRGSSQKVQSLSLAWSEYKSGRWMPSRSSVDDWVYPSDFYVPWFFFRTEVNEQNNLEIIVYYPHHDLGPIPEARFILDPCDHSLYVDDEEGDPFFRNRYFLVAGIHLDYMAFRENPTSTVVPDYRLLLNRFDTELKDVTGLDQPPILYATPGTFKLTVPQQYSQFHIAGRFFFADERHTYLVTPRIVEHEWYPYIPWGDTDVDGTGPGIPGLGGEPPGLGPVGDPVRVAEKKFRFEMFYHPYMCHIIRRLNEQGINGLLASTAGDPEYLDRQRRWEGFDAEDPHFDAYEPKDRVIDPFPVEEFDFALNSAYGLYNWEIYFHIPLLVAERLSQDRQFEEAQRWFHYIFNPTDASNEPRPARFWQILPFYGKALDPPETIGDLLRELAAGSRELVPQIRAWRENPFNPHLIARMRILAYMRTVIQKYLDNLIAWGDDLFRRDTIESTNEAAQLYLLAAEILGEKPEFVERPQSDPQTFAQVKSRTDAFSNLLTELETIISAPPRGGTTMRIGEPDAAIPAHLLYFCIPPNEKLLEYWDIVADRLFKIRHCMNIEGQARALPLYEPPIDPALLVRAVAAGIDLRRALRSLTGREAHSYRYTILYQKALELCNEVRGLGNALLSALEKGDAEELSLIRARHETSLHDDLLGIKQQQIEEAVAGLETLQISRLTAEKRLEYYTSRSFTNVHESRQLRHMSTAADLQSAAGVSNLLATYVSLIPDFKIGSPFTAGSTFGGTALSSMAKVYAQIFEWGATEASYQANRASLLGSFHRRQDDWSFQASLAESEIQQIDKQILAAEIRVAIAERDLGNQQRQLERSREVDDYLRNKFTSRQLYRWMVGQLSGLYYQAYNLAFKMAQVSQAAAARELGVDETEFAFIRPGHWESLKKGLLAGEKLNHELRRLDVAYHEKNRRELELTKHVSLAMLDPVALIELKETGECDVVLPEAIFDLDYPGHYMRRIKSLSLTIPCVTGPYTGVHCTLTLHKHEVRREASLDADPQVTHGAVQAITTSSGQTDSGLFELNFRDERYLPFEGAGAVSNWRLELSGKWRTRSGELVELPQFDFDTISDVIFHINYTARDGGVAFRDEVSLALRGAMNRMLHDLAETRTGLLRLFSLRHEFPNEWHRFIHPASATDNQTLTLPLNSERFPFLFQGKDITINKIELFVKVKPDFTATHNESTLKFTLAAGDTAPNASNARPDDILTLALWNELLRGEKSAADQPGNWTVNAWLNAGDRLNAEAIEDIVIVCHYTIAGS